MLSSLANFSNNLYSFKSSKKLLDSIFVVNPSVTNYKSCVVSRLVSLNGSIKLYALLFFSKSLICSGLLNS